MKKEANEKLIIVDGMIVINFYNTYQKKILLKV